MSEDSDPIATVKKIAKKLEIESLPPYLKLVLGKELTPEQLTPEQARKVVAAMKAKAQRLGISLEDRPARTGGGGASEKQLQFIESLVARGRISPAMLTGYIKDVDPQASIPEDLTKRTASALIDRLTGLSGGGAARREDMDF